MPLYAWIVVALVVGVLVAWFVSLWLGMTILGLSVLAAAGYICLALPTVPANLRDFFIPTK